MLLIQSGFNNTIPLYNKSFVTRVHHLKTSRKKFKDTLVKVNPPETRVLH